MKYEVMEPKITVLMAVYNGAAYLKQCIDSVLGQTFGNFEFLIVDDGSTDATPGIIKSYKDARIRVVRNASNLSQVASLNIGLNYARGEYVARIDADDIMFPDRLKKQFDFMNRRVDIALCGSCGVAINERGEGMARARMPLRKEEIVATILLGEFIMVHSSVMFRKEPIMAIGKYNEAFSFTEDYRLVIDLLLRGYGVANMPEKLIKYRLHDDRISVRDSKPQIARWIIALKEFMETFTPDVSKPDREALFNFLFNAGSMNKEYWKNDLNRKDMQKIISLSGLLLDNVSDYFKFERAQQYFLKRTFFNRILNFAYQAKVFKKDLSRELYSYSARNMFFILSKPKLYIYPIANKAAMAVETG